MDKNDFVEATSELIAFHRRMLSNIKKEPKALDEILNKAELFIDSHQKTLEVLEACIHKFQEYVDNTAFSLPPEAIHLFLDKILPPVADEEHELTNEPAHPTS